MLKFHKLKVASLDVKSIPIDPPLEGKCFMCNKLKQKHLLPIKDVSGETWKFHLCSIGCITKFVCQFEKC